MVVGWAFNRNDYGGGWISTTGAGKCVSYVRFCPTKGLVFVSDVGVASRFQVLSDGQWFNGRRSIAGPERAATQVVS